MTTHRLLSIILVWPALLFADIEHGSINLLSDPVTSSASLTLAPNTTSGVTLPSGSNQGDYWLDIDPPGAQDEGIIISSAAIHLPGGNAVIASGYPSETVPLRHFVSVHRANSTIEDDTYTSFAFFPKDEFLVGQATNLGNNLALNALNFASPSINFSTAIGQNTGAEFVGNTSGVSTLDLTSLNGSSQDGILLVNGAKNENNYALSRANPDGTFTIFCQNAVVIGTNIFESDPVSFVYLPSAHSSDQIAALGRISGDGTKLLDAGDFTVTSGNNGTWRLDIAAHNNLTGTLVISPEGGGGGNFNTDNIWAYQWDPVAGDWIIESRDLPGAVLQSVGTEPAFSFAFLMTDTPHTGVVYVDASAPAGGNGESWATAHQELSDAFADLRYSDEIWIAEGTYRPSSELGFLIDTDAVELYGGFPPGGGDGTFAARNPDPATNNTVLSGDIDLDGDTSWPDADNAIHVATISSHLTDCVLDGFTISGGNADGSANESRGGGILIRNGSSPTLRNLLFEQNHSVFDGGAIMVETGGTARPSFQDVLFQNNSCANRGGAIYNWNRSCDFVNVSFLNNSATNQGGAVYNDDSLSTFTDCWFQQNSTASGGGIYNDSSSPSIVNCTFQNNSGPLGGGGIYNSSSAPTITSCIIEDNNSSAGAGVYNTSSAPLLTNCLFQNNSASVVGGAMYNQSSSAPTIINCTFQENEANGEGGGVLFNITSSSPTLINCILWNNRLDGDSNVPGASVVNRTPTSAPTYRHCLIANSGGSSSWNPVLGIDNGNNIDADPLFISATDARLQVGSPAQNAGDSSATSQLQDLDNNPRIAPFGIDLGAYELQALAAPEFPHTYFPSQGSSPSSREFWAPDSSDYNAGAGFTFTFSEQTGTLTFDTLPTVDPDGTLRFSVPEGSSGYATFEVTISDSSGTFSASSPTLITLFMGTIFVDLDATGNNNGFDLSLIHISEPTRPY